MIHRQEFNGQTVYQLVDNSGKPSQAAHTMPLWVDKQRTNVFSMPTEGNKILPFVTGKAYFKDFITACDNASSEIYIAGWQVNWDALLAPNVRLFDVLLRAAKRGVKIYVMPWDDTEPVQTYDDQTKVVLEQINELVAEARSGGCVTVALCPSFAGLNKNYFSHHQKQVVIDRKIAYVGGIDLAYGRFDDETYTLLADAEGREVQNRYNPGIPSLKFIDPNWEGFVDPDLMSGTVDRFNVPNPFGKRRLVESAAQKEFKKAVQGGWQIKYKKPSLVGTGLNKPKISANSADNGILDPSRQPRMPWNDVHCRIEGPAVAELTRNFVSRWNVVSKARLPPADAPTSYAKAGNAHIQVLRSASAMHCLNEFRAARVVGEVATQQDIHVAMQNMIAKATQFIYIENQFFVSDFGRTSKGSAALSPAAVYIKEGDDGIGDTSLWALRKLSEGDRTLLDQLPRNRILPSLLARLKQFILDNVKQQKFHIYITLPVHPEGAVIDPAIAVQVYYTMQTLVFGSRSLMNGIRRLLKARELKDSGDEDFLRVWTDEDNTEFSSVSDEQCFEYVTLLNLRNWAKLGTTYVTEQIYVHSKLMIVDDRFALLGSANINDRSLLGERDSELAVLVADSDTARVDLDGSGSMQPVRTFAHQLRTMVWNKIFGIAGGCRPATHLSRAISQPARQESWREIQRQAAQNRDLYESAFPFIPRNFRADEGEQQYASILPTWTTESGPNEETSGHLSSPLPFETNFWSKQRHTPQAEQLKNIKGFFTALPVHWTRNENIRIEYPTSIIVKNDEGGPEELASDAVVASVQRGGTNG